MSNNVIDESGITIEPEHANGFLKNENVNKQCEICQINEWIYTCPRCLIRTCSLTCVQQHKKDTECSGQRDKTAYVPLKKYTESHMMSDYTYLEDVSRQSDNLTRSRLNVDKQVKTKAAETRQRTFSRMVNDKGIHYSSLPLGMSRNKLNQSNFSKKLNNVFWSIEVHFCKNNKRRRYLEHSFPGNKQFYGFFENLLLADNPQGKGEYQLIRHELSDFITTGIDNFVIALKKEKAPKGHFVDMTSLLHTTFDDVLKGETIIEYPIFYIWPKSDEKPAEISVLEEKKQLISVIGETTEDIEEDQEESSSSSSDEDEASSSSGEEDNANENTNKETTVSSQEVAI